MRLKLVLIASLVAAVVGAGAVIAIVLAFSSSLDSMWSPDLVVAASFLLPLLTSLLGAVFVYRHTARRRKLQAILTAILSILLGIAGLLVASLVTARSKPVDPPTLEQVPIARVT
jgi:uncharacterized membrane protein YdcZ (DUF606 family)